MVPLAQPGAPLVATAGSDVHGPGRQYESGSTGFCVVYADQLSETGVLRGVGAGHLYLSRGPRLSFAVRRGVRRRGMMGDRVAVLDASGVVSLAVSWDGASDAARLQLIAGGRPRDTLPISAAGAHEWVLDPAVPAARWYTVEMRAHDGSMLALTNPIFFAAV